MAESPDQVPSEDGNSFLEDELEALRSIYVNETNVYEDNEATIVSIDLHPATADNLQEQYVKLTLKLTIKDGYPDVIPEINIRNPRGLSDEKLSSISNDLSKIAEDKRGNSMLFEIIEAAKDYLTAGNRPCEECAICLYGFHDDDIFTKTECYHYFHSHCLARYAKNSPNSDEDDSKSDDSSKNELLCPVCRLPIHFDGVDDSYPSPVKGDDEFSVTETMLQTQKKLQELYIKQVEKGGIIDLEAEKNKYLIEISHVPSVLDAAPETKSDDETSLQTPSAQDKTQSTSPSENIKNDKLDFQKNSSTRSSNSERTNRRSSKYNEERKGNEMSRPYYGNDYRNERYQSNRGSDGYRNDQRSGRNNYDRRYDSYNNERSDRYSGGVNRNRFSNPRRNNWHENQHKSNQYERQDKYNDRNSQRYERNDKYDDRNSQRYDRYDDRNRKRYERNDKYDGRNNPNYERHDDGNSQRLDNPRGQRKKQHDSEEGAMCREDVEDDQSLDNPRQRSDNPRGQGKKQHDSEEGAMCRNDVEDDRSHDSTRQRFDYPRGQRKKQHDSQEGSTCRDDVEDDQSHGNSQRFDNPRDQRKKQHDSEEGATCRDDVEDDRSHDIDQRSDNDDENVQGGQTDKGSDEKRNNRYGGDRKNMSYSGGHRNNQYDDRRDNRYDRQNIRYDNNKRYGRYEDSRTGQYDRRNGRFDSRKYNEHSGSRRNEMFAPGRSNKANETNRNKYSNLETEDKEAKFSNGNEVNAKNTRTLEEESKNSSIPEQVANEENLIDSENRAEPDTSSTTLLKDEVVSEGIENASESQHESKLSNYSSDRKHNFPYRNSGARWQNDGRHYNRNYQRSNSNGDRFNSGSGYSKQSNYHSERRQSKPQHFRKNSDNWDESENSNQLKSNEAVAEGAGEPNDSNSEDNQVYNNEESKDIIDNQHSRKSSARTDSGNTNHYKNYRDGRQGYNRYQNNNKNYHETRPYRNNPRSRNIQNDYSDRTSNGSKRYNPQKYAGDSSHDIPQAENDTDIKHETISKESAVESVPVETSSKKPTQVPPKSSDLEKSVPTSNFLPPMSSVAPPPGFQNPTRKIVYGLAAANPPPGFNRS